MTDEQIKQNAEDFARKVNTFAEDESVFFAVKDGYIAGAHSCDEEIKQLKKCILSTKNTIAKLTNYCGKKRE